MAEFAPEEAIVPPLDSLTFHVHPVLVEPVTAQVYVSIVPTFTATLLGLTTTATPVLLPELLPEVPVVPVPPLAVPVAPEVPAPVDVPVCPVELVPEAPAPEEPDLPALPAPPEAELPELPELPDVVPLVPVVPCAVSGEPWLTVLPHPTASAAHAAHHAAAPVFKTRVRKDEEPQTKGGKWLSRR